MTETCPGVTPGTSVRNDMAGTDEEIYMQNREYFDTVMCGITDVLADEKRLLIVSSGKSTLAYETAVMLAERNHLSHHVCTLRCEDGKIHEHVLIGREAHYGWKLIDDCKRGLISRPMLQFDLGKLLGYTQRDILDFVASKLARHCPCDCCGGPFVDEKYFDDPYEADVHNNPLGTVELCE